MAGYAADVNEYCGRTLFLRVSCARNMLPLSVNKNTKRVSVCFREAGGACIITYGEVFGEL